MGVVIPFRRPIPPKKEEPKTYYSDLDEMLAITNKLAYPSIIMLLTGHWLHILHDKNHGDVEASLDDVKDFVRGLRQEITVMGKVQKTKAGRRAPMAQPSRHHRW